MVSRISKMWFLVPSRIKEQENIGKTVRTDCCKLYTLGRPCQKQGFSGLRTYVTVYKGNNIIDDNNSCYSIQGQTLCVSHFVITSYYNKH